MRPAARTDRETHGDLALTRRGAREQQRRDVGAGDDQHQPTIPISTSKGRTYICRRKVHPVPPGAN
jgi:hypothetical protein